MNSCLLCGGTGITAFGKPCPNCSSEAHSVTPFIEIPMQYRGLTYDQSFIPTKLQNTLGKFMTELKEEIISMPQAYQKNVLVCSRANAGKTVWAYDVYSNLKTAGLNPPKVIDIVEARNIMNGKDVEESDLISKSKIAIFKVPSDVAPWMFNIIQSIVERRVRNNAATIFLYSNSLENLKLSDTFNVLETLKGTGSFNTILIQDF